MEEQCRNCTHYRHWKHGPGAEWVFLGRCFLSGQDVSRSTAACVLYECNREIEEEVTIQTEVGQCGDGSKTLAR